jgi:hypothetical protein
MRILAYALHKKREPLSHLLSNWPNTTGTDTLSLIEALPVSGYHFVAIERLLYSLKKI